MWWFAVIMYVAAVLVMSSCAMCRCQWRRVLIIAALIAVPTLLWYLWSPFHFGRPSVLKSVDRPLFDGQTLRNWGDTSVCTPNKIYRPDSVQRVQSIVASARHIRVVAGGHSWTPLVCSDDTVLTLQRICGMSDIDNDTATFDAGCSIRYAQEQLQLFGKQLHGYGSIQEQSLAGGFMTSLHGVQFESFASHVLSLDAVLANGTLIQTEDIDLWQGSMGMLGIVVRMTMRIYPSKTVLVTQQASTLEHVLDTMERSDIIGMDAKTVWGYGSDVYNLRTFSKPRPASIHIHHDPGLQVFLNDNVALPVILLASQIVYYLPIAKMYYPEHEVERVDITNAWYRFPEYGGKSAEYAIPLRHCKEAMREIRNVARPYLVTADMRLLKIAPGCLSWVREPSCLFDTTFIDASLFSYDTSVVRYHTAIENIVYKYGGNTHWGKYHASPYVDTNMPCLPTFKRARRELDPTDKFLNAFTIAVLNGTRAWYPPSAVQSRGMVHKIAWVFTAFSIFIVYVWTLDKGKYNH
jgi:FAD/FMN-containing dehydrogenase